MLSVAHGEPRANTLTRLVFIHLLESNGVFLGLSVSRRKVRPLTDIPSCRRNKGRVHGYKSVKNTPSHPDKQARLFIESSESGVKRNNNNKKTPKLSNTQDGGDAADYLDMDPCPVRDGGITSRQYRPVCLYPANVCTHTRARGPPRVVVVGQLCQVL